ncbi:MAG: AAA family ATPase, partial [Chitinivibrionales bacterium]|nr:AAA family ATPase [Chitinivibrionales bacterium]MBD3356460.1 AAA family ATPase [Chitinivibrionales bacterium]
MIPRHSEKLIARLMPQYPVLAITGPRQSGKTTLARKLFGDRPYVSLENPDEREFAESDPRSFLKRYREGAVFDEVQRAPELLSYLQQIIDEGPKECRFVLTGSQQFGLMSQISQSLAGRVANVTLLPFSYSEWYSHKTETPPSLEEVLFKGLYPPVLDRALEPSTWYRNYAQTYVERDVRQIAAIGDLRLFHTFLRMCAARTGQLLNLSGLASDCGIAVNTAKKWLSILEAGYIIHLLQPHFANFGKRLIKTPKLYFVDPGLACYLLSVNTSTSLQTHAMRVPLFETYAVSELKKFFENTGHMGGLYFWRDRAGHEVDIVIDESTGLSATELKAGRTVASDWLKGLQKWKTIAGSTARDISLIYGGEREYERQDARI